MQCVFNKEPSCLLWWLGFFVWGRIHKIKLKLFYTLILVGILVGNGNAYYFEYYSPAYGQSTEIELEMSARSYHPWSYSVEEGYWDVAGPDGLDNVDYENVGFAVKSEYGNSGTVVYETNVEVNFHGNVWSDNAGGHFLVWNETGSTLDSDVIEQSHLPVYYDYEEFSVPVPSRIDLTYYFSVPHEVEIDEWYESVFDMWVSSWPDQDLHPIDLEDIISPPVAALAGATVYSQINISMTLPEEEKPVPEPATMLLLGTGLAGLAAIRRKFKKR